MANSHRPVNFSLIMKLIEVYLHMYTYIFLEKYYYMGGSFLEWTPSQMKDSGLYGFFLMSWAGVDGNILIRVNSGNKTYIPTS